ncbi:MAG: NAD-dependent epimerase/dehydratase family protein [Gammaproteobacteria bacterium]|nr:NAD-dependent epimerase/dehydratase family protein [Gammaproteobacteria bacterium]
MLKNSTFAQPFKGKKVLITGATGFTGRVLTHKLINAGAKVRIIARESSAVGDLDDSSISWFRGDISDPELALKAADGVEYIFHVAAAFREVKATIEDYRKIHLYSTQNLVHAVQSQPQFLRFIHISTVGVHGHIPGDDLADETYRFEAGDDYQSTKLEAELWLNKFSKDSDFPYCVIRPAAIYGPGDRRLLKIFKMANKGFFLFFGKGKGIYHLVHVDDLTNIMLKAAIEKTALKETFIAAGNEPIAMVDMAKIIACALDKRLRVIRLPITPMFIMADICNAVCKRLGIDPPLHRRRVAFYTKDRKFNNRKIRKVLGYNPIYDNKTGLTELAHWYQKHGWLDPKG